MCELVDSGDMPLARDMLIDHVFLLLDAKALLSQSDQGGSATLLDAVTETVWTAQVYLHRLDTVIESG
jgi:hypothetical protein